MTVGIYGVLNTEVGCISYIGKSSNIEKRVGHILEKLRKRKFPGSRLQESFDRLGSQAFRIQVLEETSREKLSEREKYWIEQYTPEGNIAYTPRQAESFRKISKALLGKKASPESKARMSESAKGNTAHLGHKHSKESRKKISERVQGRTAWNKGKEMDEEYREKSRKGSLGNNNRKNSRTSEEALRNMREKFSTPEAREQRRQQALAQHARKRQEREQTE